MSALLESVESARQARGEVQGGAGGDAASVHDRAGHVERKAANAPAKKAAKAPGKSAQFRVRAAQGAGADPVVQGPDRPCPTPRHGADDAL
ncbi:hypothetical protein [Streptomyces sp. NPDC055287]